VRGKLVLVVCSLLVFGLSLALARGPDFGESSPVFWRAWQPLVSAFGAGDPLAAIAYLRAASAIVRKADAQLARDAASERFRKRALDSLEDFDLQEFLALLPYQERESRSFAFAGWPSAKAYEVHALGSAAPVFGSGRDRDRVRELRALAHGHVQGALRMRRAPHESERRYVFQTRTRVGLGALRWQPLLAGLVDAARLLETRGEQDVPLALRAADSYLRTRQSALGARDRAIMVRLWGGFPGVAQLLLPISRSDDVLVERDPEPGVTGLSVSTRWDLASMKRKYPALAHYFDALDDIARVHARLSDAAGNTLLELDSGTERLETKLRGFLRGGRLLARTKKGALVPAQFARMRLTLDLHFVLHRIRLNIEDLQLDLEYREQADGASLRVQSARVPKVQVSGAAFGLVPTRVLDWFIPGDVETLARHMFEVAAQARGGHGSLLEARFREGERGANLELGYETELLDTRLVRFCMAVIAEAAIPSEEEERDMTRLAVDYRDAFDADLARFAQFGAETWERPVAAP
jgi:hypothetical protein